MKRISIFFFLLFAAPGFVGAAEPFKDWKQLLAHKSFQISRADLITYEHMLQIYKVAEKGYASNYILEKGLKETVKHPNLSMFHEWLSDLKRYPTLAMPELIKACLGLRGRLISTSGLSRLLLTQRLTSCRQITLQQLAPKILADRAILPDEYDFLQKFMRPLVHGQSRSDFIWFMQRLEKHEESRLAVSRLVTEYVIQRNRQVPRDLLPALSITPELTGHVQNFGLDADSSRQIFQQEFSRQIEESYSAIERKPPEQLYSIVRELGTWLRVNGDKINRDAAYGRFSDLAKNLWRNGHIAQAQDMFDQVMREGSKEQRDDAMFFRLWIWVSKGNLKEAYGWIEQNKLPARFEDISDSRLKFWVAQVLQDYGKGEIARGLFEKCIENHPLSFYAIMAVKSITAMHPESSYKNFYANSVKDDHPELSPEHITEDIAETMRRLRAWARLDNRDFLSAEIRGIRRSVVPSGVARVAVEQRAGIESDLLWLTSAIIGDERNFIESFRVAYVALESKRIRFGRAILEILYPTPYFEQLTKAMKKHPADPLLVLSLIRQESVFNPEARSRVGARGLMQLMPTTAKRFKRGVREGQLGVPVTNLEIGTRYVENLYNRYDGNLVQVLAAYNAGEARVEKWKSIYFNSERMLANIENIPFLETRNYVKLIFRNLFFYKMLEGKKSASDNTAHNYIHDVPLGFTR